MARRRKIRFRKGTPKALLNFKGKHSGKAPKGAILDTVAVGSCKRCGEPITKECHDKYGMYCPICAQYSQDVWKGDVREAIERQCRGKW